MAYIRKRTTSRGARYDVRLEIGGRTISKTFTRRRDPEQWASLMEADRFRGMAVDPGAGRIKVVTCIETWIDARQLAPRTVELYGYLARRSIAPSFGDTEINRLTPDAVRRWHKDIATTQSAIQAASCRPRRSIRRSTQPRWP